MKHESKSLFGRTSKSEIPTYIPLIYLFVSVVNVMIISLVIPAIILFFEDVYFPYISPKPLDKVKVPITQIPISCGDNDDRKKNMIRNNFLDLYYEYKRKAYKHDYMIPVPPYYYDDYNANITLLEALPTLYIMGMKKETEKALRDMNFSQMNLPKNVSRSTFIGKIISPLLSVFDISHIHRPTSLLSSIMKFFLIYDPEKPEPTDLMTTDFQGMLKYIQPNNYVEMHKFGSIQVEYISCTRFYRSKMLMTTISRPYGVLMDYRTKCLVPNGMNLKSNKYTKDYSLSEDGRSYLEYFLKMDLMSNGTAKVLRNRLNYLQDDLKKLNMSHNNFILRIKNFKVVDEVSIDDAFLPGIIALNDSEQINESKKYLEAFLSLNNTNKFGLFPTSVSVKEGIKMIDRNVSIPVKLMESLFIMYRTTKNATYRDIAWDIHQKIIKHCKCKTGFSNVILSEDGESLTQSSSPIDSNVLGGYYTYLYLLFSDSSSFPFDEWVFNWRGHPLLRSKQPINTLDFGSLSSLDYEYTTLPFV